ncbi:MAG TPA: glycoside hydrolase family 16 protein [Jatrophihabitans sp.]|nr:glycoside hydrolase family 16 protein [Jatrophihabitans sp.]
MRAVRRCLLVLAVAAAVLGVTVPSGAAGAATAPYCGPTVLKPDGVPWRCTFADDFSGRSLDPTRWTPVTTANSGLRQGGACYVDSPNNIAVRNGALNLTVRREYRASTCIPGYYTQYTAGQVATTGRFAQQYGRFSIRARFPAATVAGLQSSLWMWPQTSGGGSGEIDIAEEYSKYADRAIPYLHYAYDPATVNAATGVNVVTNNWCRIRNVAAFHVYTVTWTARQIAIDYDGQTCLVDNLQPAGASPFDQPFFLLLTQTLGTGANGFQAWLTPLPATTQIDWVRAWK